MALAGALSLMIAGALYQITISSTPHTVPTADAYVAQIIDAKTSDPSISATTVHSQDNQATVLWLDGLEYLPDSYGL